MKHITLDTNAYSALTNGDLAVKEVTGIADIVWVPVVVVAELYYGFKKGSKEQYNIGLLQDFLQLPGVHVLHTSDSTPAIYAQLLVDLQKKGTPIPTNDIWIAALAVEANSVLITYDRHFLNLESLHIWEKLS